MREALGMAQTQLAHRLGVKRQSLDQLERNEVTGAATLATLQRAAEALGCDLQYVLIPRQPLDRMIEHQSLRRALQKLGRVNESQALEASALDPDTFSSAVKDLAKEMEVQRTADLWND
jgi:predicted DNA-binding mobile mystery protein A